MEELVDLERRRTMKSAESRGYKLSRSGRNLLNRVKRAVHELEPEAKIVLYGSRARGTARQDSDWDFLILLPRPIEPAQALRLKDRLYDIELETNMILSCIIRSKQEWMSKQYTVVPLHREIEKDGIPL